MARLRILRRDAEPTELEAQDEEPLDGSEAELPTDEQAVVAEPVEEEQAPEPEPEPEPEPVAAPVEPPAPPEEPKRPEPPKPVHVRRPPPSVLRRERRELQRLREQRLRDLGGLLLEMYRRATFREELLSEQCADLVGIETRLAEIEASLTAPRRRAPRCTCGARLLPGARFCPSCGRPLTHPGAPHGSRGPTEPAA